MSDVTRTVFTVQMTSSARHIVSVTERPHLEVIEAGLQRVAELVEGNRVGHVHHGQSPDLSGAVHPEGQGLGLDVDRVPVGLALVPHVPHVEVG